MDVAATEQVAVRIAAITEIRGEGATFTPWHEVVDTAKRDAIAASMACHGWVGPPILVDGEYACTGSHRLGAVEKLCNDEGILMAIEYVEVADLCAEFGLDWEAILYEHSIVISEADEERPEIREYDTTAALVALAERLPADVVDYLGLDVH